MSESDREGQENGRDELYEDDGVDVSLIRWMLSLSHKERLSVLQQTVNSIIRLRNAAKKSRGPIY